MQICRINKQQERRLPEFVESGNPMSFERLTGRQDSVSFWPFLFATKLL
jgi:hypothetical protein